MSRALLTFDDLAALIAGRVDAGWLDELRSTPEGFVALALAVDLFVALDAQDAARAGGLHVAPWSSSDAPPASGPQYAVTTLALTLRRSLKTTRPLTLVTGAAAQTRDGHTFRTLSTLTWGVGEVGVTKTVQAVAVLPGPLTIPPGNITQFAGMVDGLAGQGTAIDILPGGATQPKALRLRTDLTIPHAFRPELRNHYVEVSGFSAGGSANESRALQINSVNDGSAPAAPGATENEYAWGRTTVTTSDAWMAPWVTGAFMFSWRAVAWGELFAVTNTTTAEGGSLAMLDEIAQSRGRPRQDGEGDEQVRSRLRRAPEPPTPLGALRAALVALAPWGFGRLDVRIYEMGETAPSPPDIDPYAFNFPAAAGFLSDLHATDMPTPETPDGMAKLSPAGVTLTTFANPGLALLVPGSSDRDPVIVRWTPPGAMPAGTVATVRRLLFRALQDAKPGGALVFLYHPPAWGYP